MARVRPWFAASAFLIGACLSVFATANEDKQALKLSEQSLAKVLAHGPWPPSAVSKDTPIDPSNRVSGNADAIKFGKQLFFSTALSSDNKTSCATCHIPEQSFSGDLSTHSLDRDTQSILNVRFNRWFSWDGSNDNLWAQSIRPIISPVEMNTAVENVRDIANLETFSESYTQLFGDTKQQTNQAVLINLGKALAAYQETFVTGKTPFDDFREAVAKQDWVSAAKYPESAQRGLEIFLGRGNCTFCHSGANFTNGEFHDAGVPYFIRPGVVDRGRHQGIVDLKKSPFTLDGKYNDDPEKKGAWAVQKVTQLHSNFGIFRVPSLRNVANTPPYMHNGSLKTLEDVVQHYNNINMERLHTDGEAILKPMGLSQDEVDDLVAFLKSLSNCREPYGYKLSS